MGGKDLALLLPACFIGLYLLLEAVDWGLCLAAPVIGRDEKEWGYIINLMRPAVDGNELWFIIASFMLSVMVKAPAGTPASYSNWMAFTGTLIVGGACLRMLGIWLFQRVNKRLTTNMLCLYSMASLFVIGATGPLVITTNSSIFIGAAILSGIWSVIGSFQLGALYGAVKARGSLQERFRRACLYSYLLSAVIYMIFIFLLWKPVNTYWHTGAYLWLSWAASCMLFIGSFAATRKRLTGWGLGLAYAASIFALSVFLSLCITVIPLQFDIDMGALKCALHQWPATIILAVTVIWTFSVFIYRLRRKSE